MRRVFVLAILAALAAGAARVRAGEEPPRLLRAPDISDTQVVFSFSGDLWIASKDGGDARRLTSDPGTETNPHFSPDGKTIAFTGQYDGNTDVYLVPAAGGVPKRVTYHPSPDQCRGWTPDGKRILIMSLRDGHQFVPRLFTVAVDPAEGVLPAELPFPVGLDGCFSPDGKRIAYIPTFQSQRSWKRYRGGQTYPIWLVSLDDLALEKIPRENTNDFNPMWIGNRVFFLSDRDGPVTLYAYDTRNRKVSRVLKNDGDDLKTAGFGPGGIVYEQFGGLHLFDPETGSTRPLTIRVAADLPGLRPRIVDVSTRVTSGDLSPSGARAVFEARGEIFTVPAQKGDARNLTGTPGVAERSPTWSPDGKTIAYFSDESGEYELHLRSQAKPAEVRKLSLGNPASYYYNPVWSPDGKKLAFSDRRLNLWVADVETGGIRQIDRNSFDLPVLQHAWSPDSKWLAYVLLGKTRLGRVMVYSLEQGTRHAVTDGMSDAWAPQFDRSGKYLYFAASTDSGPAQGWIDLSSQGKEESASLYLAVLQKDVPNPLAPESDEEKGVDGPRPGSPPAGGAAPSGAQPSPAAGPDGAPMPAARAPAVVRIDFEGLSQRILALPMPPASYRRLWAGRAGTLFVEERSAPSRNATIHRFDLNTRRADRFAEGVTDFSLNAPADKMLLRRGESWAIVSAAQPPPPGSGTLRLSGLEIRLDPQAEWRQMYDEVWRIQREFFYDPNLHGLDLNAARQYYARFLPGLGGRGDLNYLFEEMLGQLSVGHMNVFGGDLPQARQVPGGLLGADLAVENGRYRIRRVLTGENWNPTLRAPLTGPGMDVKAGDYILEVNGKAPEGTDGIYALLEGTSGRQVRLKVGPNTDGSGAREITVVPVASESALRNRAWVEENRRKVHEATDGQAAYVYLPDTGTGGYNEFNRYFFAQLDRRALIVDERNNGGGKAADYIIDFLRRPLMNYWRSRYGEPIATPYAAIHGPKAMIINEFAGSGGDAMPWYFKRLGIGPLIGKRTWGGLVGIGGYPSLIDGGSVTAPHFAFHSPEGKWEVENAGVPPDIEVEFEPRDYRDGRDPQLERAIAWIKEELKKTPPLQYRSPEYPNYHKSNSR